LTKERGGGKKVEKPCTPGVFDSSFLDNVPKKASDSIFEVPEADRNGNRMVVAEGTDVSKDFSKQSKVRDSSGFGQSDKKVLRKVLEDAISRLEDAKRLVLKLEDEATQLRKVMQYREELEEKSVVIL